MLALVLLAVRLLVSAALAPLVAARLSHALRARVDIGDLSIQPIDAIVTLRDVTVRAPAQSDSPSQAPIVADRVRIDVQWLPLLHHTLQVRELALESARIDLDRLPDGDFSLANLERPDPTGELPADWSFALDRIVLRDSRLRVHDLAAGRGAFVEAAVRDAEISGLQRRATAFGKATNLRVNALVAGGELRVQGHYELRDGGVVLDAALRVKDVPLAQVQSYVADLGWTDLSGVVSGQLRWERAPQRRDLLRGRLVMRHAAVRVADVPTPALAVQRGVADIAAIDLLKRRIAVTSLTLHGATLAVRPQLDAPIPLLATAVRRRPAAAGSGTGAPRAPTEPAWSWSIERFGTASGRVRVLATDTPVDLRMRASAENLGPAAYWSPLRVEMRRGPVAAGFDGTVRVGGGLTVEGRLTAADLDLRSLARDVGIPGADLVQAGRVSADLTVGFDSTPHDGAPLYAQGGIALTDLWVAGDDPGGVAFAAPSVNLTLQQVALPEAGRSGGNGTRRAARLTFGDAYAAAPSLFLLRRSDGRVLPARAELEPQQPHQAVEVVLGRVRTGAGSVTLVDLVPTPPVTWELARVDGTAHDLSLPSLLFDSLALRGADRRLGRLELAVTRQAGVNSLELSASGIPLAAATPYLRIAGLPYRFSAGTGSFVAHAAVDGAGWRADTALTLRAPELIDVDAAVETAIGMSPSAAMALLRDEAGDVTLQLALASVGHSDGATSEQQVAAGIRDSIARAREVAAERAAFAPVTVLFPPGQAELTGAAMQELAPVGKLLGVRPELTVELSADTSHADRRWLVERALQAQLDGNTWDAVRRAFGMRDTRDRLRAALAERGRGARGTLDRDEEALLGQLLAEAPPPNERDVAALRNARVASVMTYFGQRYGIAPDRVVVPGAAPRGGVALAAVRAQIIGEANPALDLRRSAPVSQTDVVEAPAEPPSP